MDNELGVVYNGNPAEMQEGMAQLPDAVYVLGTSEMETFISLLKNGDSAYALVQISTGKVEGHKMKLMGALQDRLIFTGKKGADHVIIPYSEIDHVDVSCGWIACGISIYKKDGNLIKFDSVLKVGSRHFDDWFSSYNSGDVSETELQTEMLDLDFTGDVSETSKKRAKKKEEKGGKKRAKKKKGKGKGGKKRVLYTATNEWGDNIEVHEDFIDITYVDLQLGMLDLAMMSSRPTFENNSPEIDVGGWWFDLKYTRKLHNSSGPGLKRIKNKDIRRVKFIKEGSSGFIKINSEPGLFIFFGNQETWWPIAQHLGKISALEAEKNLDEERAIKVFDEFLLPGEAKRIRQKIQDEGRVKIDQTVVHGDYVDDRDTIVKDSVISKSNIGAGGDDKFTKLKELKEMLSEGLIDKEEFKEMKKEILGK